jgi:hypothetical protein
VRQLADRDRIGRFMAALGRDAPSEARVYLTGGATAVLIGWRDSTIDVDIKLVPDDGSIMRAIPALKESLQINVEFASPADFLPVLDGWPDRSPYIERRGSRFTTLSLWPKRCRSWNGATPKTSPMSRRCSDAVWSTELG